MKSLSLRSGILLTTVVAIFISNYIQAQDLNSATFLTRSEQYDKAQSIFEQLIQKGPKNSKNYFFYGENYLLEYFADTISNSLTIASKAAKDLFEKGVSTDPNDPLNYIGLAKIAFYLDDYKTAEEMRTKAKSFLLPYKNIKRIVPPAKDYAFALAKIAESYIKDDKVDTSLALPLIREAIKIDSKNRDIFLIAGDIYILANDGSHSIKNYKLAQYCDPQSPTANMKIGSIYVRGRNLMAAIPYFEEAIKLNSNYAPAYRELGQLYSSAGRFELSKMNFQKYLELTQGNIPAKIRYVTALFYAKEYDEVNKNVDEIMAIDKSRSYMNRIAGYSSYEKEPPDYSKALAYMNTLFKSVSPDRIIKKDYYYMARILLGKNQNYPDLIKENDRCKSLLERENKRYSDATVALKAKLRLNIDSLTIEIANLNTQISKANIEIDSAFVEYDKRLSYDPKDNILLNEIASNYYRYNRFDDAARTWSKMIDLGKNNIGDYMQIGKAYYIGEKYKTADSVFNIIINKDPNYLPAYLMIARTYSKMDPDFKLGIAKPKFEKLINAAKVDSLSNESEMMEAFEYLSYFYMMNDNFSRSKDYYIRMINLDPNSKENKIKGYNGIGSVELRSTSTEKTNEGRLPYLSRAADAYNKILAIDPINTLAKGQISYIHYFEAQIKKGINPNEIKGIVKNEAGHPLAYASIRVKDTAVENLTNQRGEYKFEIPQESETLIISAIGYKSKELAISKTKRVYNVTLEQ